MYSTNKTKKLFQKLISEFGVDELSCKLGTSSKNILALAKTGDIDAYDFMQIARKCNFSTASMLNGHIIDENCIIRLLKGEKEICPPKYLKRAKSFRRSSRAILDSIGPEIGQEALCYLQTTPDFFADKNLGKKVSTSFNYDLLLYLKKHASFKDKHLECVGRDASYALEDSEFAKGYENLGLKQTLERALEENYKYIEQNHDWKILKLTDKNAVIEKKFRDENIRKMIHDNYTTNESCKYIMGFTSSIYKYSQQVFVECKETRCAFHGDKACRFEMNFTKTKRAP